MAAHKPQTANRKPQSSRIVPLLLAWFAANARDLPWRRTHDPYAIWVSEIMLQQTQVKTVIPYWDRWMRDLPTVKAAAHASPDKLHKLWEGLGYYTRVRNLQRAAQVIVEKHDVKFPETFDDILALPGIGRYTAGALCSIAFNQPTPILDGNVIRVLTRIFGIAENPKTRETNEWLWALAGDLVCHAKAQSKGRDSALRCTDATARRPCKTNRTNCCSFLNQSLMELGALVCTPRNPTCEVCPVKKLCVAFKEKRVEELPNLGKREAATARHFITFAIERDGKYLVRQRPAGIVNAHLWEFPNVEINGGNLRPEAIFKSEFGFEAKAMFSLTMVKHSITRYRVTLDAFRVRIAREYSGDGAWKSLSQMRALAFTSAHKKVLSQLTTAGG